MRHGHRGVLSKYHPKLVRDTLWAAIYKAREIHLLEHHLIVMLEEIDKKRFYVRFGCYSLKGFCEKKLGFTRIQSQRIVTAVRRLKPPTSEAEWMRDL